MWFLTSLDVIDRHSAGPLQDSDAAAADADEHWHSLAYARRAAVDVIVIYTVNHKKRDILFLTITLVNVYRFL